MDLKARSEDMRSFFNRKAKEDYDSIHLTMMNSKEPVGRKSRTTGSGSSRKLRRIMSTWTPR